ncbi:YbhB/YbcL family Raf kinase inhibitor-like protein [Nitrospirillum sp. BR 11164]|uniref:YbhB/YbcL family Raf kinase inhibitor-like protein n=1 Tax=Nitrospirillum sp. BR 11164 TaxID=3104324 RepID=UPI002AFEBF4C|nr:YbhB/YbcL family Raf kinase inhibitor-like protein [Nitrospirillum sp. BR 11164]MEA1651942.1 YbhB/YbcL family Raf kinase inhibitor-like protein [Nitrospirillum sp. BR 11164]
MGRRRVLGITLATGLAAGLAAGTAQAGMWLSSPDLAADGTLTAPQAWDRDGCGGKNISPALRWGGEAPTTKSFALIIMDADVKKGFRHWMVFNIPAGVHSLAAGAGAADGKALPKGAVQALNDFGPKGYGGPCPPPGQTHRYVFTLYALNKDTLDLNPDQPAGALESLVLTHALDKGRLLAKSPRFEAAPEKAAEKAKPVDAKPAPKAEPAKPEAKPEPGKAPEPAPGDTPK